MGVPGFVLFVNRLHALTVAHVLLHAIHPGYNEHPGKLYRRSHVRIDVLGVGLLAIIVRRRVRVHPALLRVVLAQPYGVHTLANGLEYR